MKKFIVKGLLMSALIATPFLGIVAEARTATSERSIATESSYRYKGRVLDAQSRQPLAYATLVVLGSTQGATTDEEGHFVINDVRNREAEVRVTFVGYGTKVIRLTPGEDILIELEPTSINMEEVVVSANRTETRRHLAPILVNVTDAKLFTNVNAVTLDETLKFNPGVRVEDNCQNCGFNQVRINGLEGAYSQIVINSRNIFSALAGVYALELFPTSMIDRVEVVRGGASALYGSSAIGGTVNIITKAPTRNMAEASYTISGVQDNYKQPMHDVGLFASVLDESSKAGISIFGKMKSRPGLDLIRPGSKLPGGKDGYSDIPQINFATVGTSAFYNVTPSTNLVFDYFYTQEKRRGGDRLDRPYHEAHIAEGVEHQIHTGIVQLNQYTFDGDGLLNAFVAGSHTNRDSYYGGGGVLSSELNEALGKAKDLESIKDILNGVNAGMESYGNTKDLTMQAGLQYNHNFERFLFMPSELTAGVEHLYNNLKDLSGYRPAPIKQVAHTTSLFLQNEWRNDLLGFLIGGRYDHVDLVNGEMQRKLNIITPRATFRIMPLEGLTLRASYAEGFRAPQFFDEELHVAFAGGEGKPRVLANDLKEERSRSGMLSADYYLSFGNGMMLNLMAEGFYTLLQDKFNPEEITRDGKEIFEVRNAGKARVYGLNMEARLAYLNQLTLNLGFTYQRSLFDEAQEVGLDASIKSREILRTPNAYGYFVANWTPNHHFSWTISGDYTGKMFVPHEPGDKEGDYITETTETGVLKVSKPFMVLGTKVGYSFHIENSMLELSLGVNNIFNAYQKDFDEGPNRASAYIYGPKMPRTIFCGLKLSI